MLVFCFGLFMSWYMPDSTCFAAFVSKQSLGGGRFLDRFDLPISHPHWWEASNIPVEGKQLAGPPRFGRFHSVDGRGRTQKKKWSSHFHTTHSPSAVLPSLLTNKECHDDDVP